MSVIFDLDVVGGFILFLYSSTALVKSWFGLQYEFKMLSIERFSYNMWEMNINFIKVKILFILHIRV
jgi:hypothetical protein